MKSAFGDLHPVSSITYYVIALIFAMWCLDPISLIIILSGAIGYCICLCGFQETIAKLKFLAVLGITIIVVNPLINQRGRWVIFTLFNKSITMEALLYGLMMSLSLIAIFALFVSYQYVIDHHKFLYLFGRFFPKSAFLTTMTLRYIPLLKRRIFDISLVQQIKGPGVAKGKLRSKIAQGMELISILMTWSLENAIDTADSMAARGYGLTKRTSYHNYRWLRQDTYSLILQLIIAGVLSVARLKGYLYLPVYPQMVVPQRDLTAWCLQGLLLVYMFLPLIIDGKEKLRWHFIALRT